MPSAQSDSVHPLNGRYLPDLPPDVLDAGDAVRGHILVIDDEPDIRESLEALLSSENYRVELAANATEGLKRLEGSTYDLVLLDLMMPDKSGMQVLEEIRARDRETPIFMITAYGSVEVAVDGAEARRQRLFLQALGQRKAADRDRSHDLEAPPGARKYRAQARSEAALQLPEHRRQERADAQDPGPGRPGGGQPRDHSDHRAKPEPARS